MYSKLNKIRIRVEGLNQLRLIKNLVGGGIKLEKVDKIKNDCLKMTINGRYKAKTFAILEKLCYNYTVEWDYSIRSCFGKALRRVGVVLGMAIGIAFCILAGSVIISVKTVGLTKDISWQIKAIVKQEAGLPTASSSINLSGVERVVLSTGLVSSVSARLEGNQLIIEALPLDGVREEEPVGSAIISSDDAVITRIIVEKGSSLVSVGEIVKKGDLLVSGDIYDTTGEKPLYSVEPKAIVYGEVVERQTVSVPAQKIVKMRTGRLTTKASVLLPWQKLSMIAPYESFDVELTTGNLTAVLPLKVVSTTYYETTFETRLVDAKNEAEQLLDKMSADCPYEVKSKKYYLFPMDGGYTRITAYLVREKIISQYNGVT